MQLLIWTKQKQDSSHTSSQRLNTDPCFLPSHSSAPRTRPASLARSSSRSDPVIVLSLAVVFVFSVVFLHLATKFGRWVLK